MINRNRAALCSVFLLVLLWGSIPAKAQVTAIGGKNRPTIGLALAGGGALGFAHIGVIEWMEENRIPVDGIAGTSMGGLVGGFYATGMSPKEMRDLIAKFDWGRVVSGVTPYKLLGFRRKEDRRNIQNPLEIGFKNGFSLPSGLNPATTVDILLSRISLPYQGTGDFDTLPIPFRAVATDLGSGDPVALQKGDLDTAMRASMSLPALFTPVLRDGLLLSDGAAVQNLPTETAKAMGADIIIAVDLLSGLSKATGIRSLTDVLGQSVGIAVLNNVRRSRELATVIITPELTGVGSFDFTRGNELADIGYASAEANRAKLLPYALSEADWAVYKTAREARRRGKASEFVPAFIAVEGDRFTDIRRQIRQKANEPLDPAKLERDLLRLTGYGRYEGLSYTKQKRADGKEGLLIRVRTKPYGPPFANFGIEAARIDRGNSRFVLATRITNYGVLGHDDEVRVDARVGTVNQFAGEYYRRLNRTGFFLAPRAFYAESLSGRYNGTSRVASYIVRGIGGGVDIGYNPDAYRELRAGFVLQNLKSSVVTGACPNPPSAAPQPPFASAMSSIHRTARPCPPVACGSKPNGRTSCRLPR